MLYHAWYQMVLGAVAASEHAASEGASGMGEALRFRHRQILPSLSVAVNSIVSDVQIS